ncbi:jumonji superfamily protein [Crassisporium funariophilum]|nr:jumonji superfamily protein [Crassisporium funariophilum]
MAPSRRRSTRNGQKSPGPAQNPSQSPEPATETAQPHGNDDSCPSCTSETRELMNGSRKENWIECDNCNTWYHWRCAGNGEDVENIAKWYCETCTQADATRIMTLKAPARKSSRKRTHRDYANLNSGLGSDPNRWLRMLETKEIKDDRFKRLKGSELESWLEDDEDAMREPVVIEKPEGLGMQMPDKELTVEDVAQLVGEDVPIEVIDVASQSTSPGWDLGKWADYYSLEPSKREKVLNVISLEISGTELSHMILPPKIVRDLDWVENFWPSTRKGKGHVYPKVQLYCLMGVANAWTDWHVDFAGSSVYYHILHGSKVFYFIKPTPANLAAYEKWSGSELQYQTWLGDMVDEVCKVELVEGNTMIIPSGWIHAVYTPVDTLVFGGNFLHSYAVETQIRVRNIEIATQVPKKFRFPMFSRLCWYVGDKYLRDLKSASGASLSPRVLSGILALAEFLVSEARVLESGSEQAKKEVKEQVPTDRVKDAPAVARELRWRTKLALGYSSDDEGSGGPRKSKKSSSPPVGSKRKRMEDQNDIPHFRNFKPKPWDAVVITKDETDKHSSQGPRPREEDEWTSHWITDSGVKLAEGEEANVESRREVVVKVRRTMKGLERQRIERTIEEWTWDENERT